MSARNVFNVDAVDRFVSGLAATARSPAVAHWVCRTVRRWVLTEHDRYWVLRLDARCGAVLLQDPRETGPVVQDTLASIDAVPAWCRKALESGQRVIQLRLGRTLAKRIRRVIGYLDHEFGGASAAKLNRISFADAERGMRHWRRAQWQERRRLQAVEPVYRGADGVRIVRLRSRDSLADEGARMAHCVASYAEDVSDGLCEIYSLRDRDNQPQATVEVINGGRVLQVKGRANGFVAPDVRHHLRSFIRSRHYVLDDDYVNVAAPLQCRADALDFGVYLQSAEGRKTIQSYVYSRNDTLGRADQVGLIELLLAYRQTLTPTACRAVHDALLPSADAPARLRRVGTFHVYDMTVPVFRVDAAVAWLSLAANGAFEGVPGIGHRFATLRRQAELRVASLCVSAPDRVYLLGPIGAHDLDCAVGWLSAADLLRSSRIEALPSIRGRHDALRRRANRHKARAIGRRAAPSEAHRAFQRLLGGAWGEVVI